MDLYIFLDIRVWIKVIPKYSPKSSIVGTWNFEIIKFLTSQEALGENHTFALQLFLSDVGFSTIKLATVKFRITLNEEISQNI